MKGQKERISRLEAVLSSLEKRFDELVVRIAEIADTMRWRHVPGRWRHALEALADNPIARAALDARKDVRVWGEPDARAADRVIKREVKSTRAELGALAEEVKRMRGSSRELEPPEAMRAVLRASTVKSVPRHLEARKAPRNAFWGLSDGLQTEVASPLHPFCV